LFLANASANSSLRADARFARLPWVIYTSHSPLAIIAPTNWIRSN